MKKKSSLRRFLTNIYLHAFFNRLMMLSPLYAIFMQEHGMTDMQLSFLFILLSVGTFCMQIPTTWLMNLIGKKNTVIVGQLAKAAAFALWLLVPNFWGFAVGMFIWGIQYAAHNVAYESIIYEGLRARRNHDIYARVLGTRYNFSAVGAALSSCGSLLLLLGLDYAAITYISIAVLGLSIFFIARVKLPEHSARHRTKHKPRFMTVFKTGTRICMRTPCIFLMMVLTLVVSNICYLDDYISPIGIEIGLPLAFVGIAQFFIMGCTILGQTFAYRFKSVPDWILYTTICAAGFSYVMFSIFYSVSGLWLLGLGYVLFAGIYVLLYSRFQDFLPTSYRSVILSLYSIGDNMIYVITCLLVGLGGSMGSWRFSVLLLGAILVATGLWALLVIRDKCALAQNPSLRPVKTLRPASDDMI